MHYNYTNNPVHVSNHLDTCLSGYNGFPSKFLEGHNHQPFQSQQQLCPDYKFQYTSNVKLRCRQLGRIKSDT